MMDFTGWKYYTNSFTNENIGITITKGNVQESRSLQDPDVVKWLASGGQPLPAESN